MRTALAAIMLAISTLSLTACGGGSADDAVGTGTETNTYRGEDITCIKDGMINSAVRTCDYTVFYAENPDLLDESAEDMDDEGVWWTTYRDEPIPCYKEGSLNANTLSCDYVWFYAQHPNLLG